ncbi:MAG: NAD-binding protein, partial [Actinomycetota bacterium]
MQAIIAGCGRVGSQLAMLLSYEGHNVVIIDKDPDAFHRLESPFNGLALTGIAFDEGILKEAGIEEAEAFASLTNYDNTNLMASEIAADLFGVPMVIARVYNPDKEITYRKMGIDHMCGSTMVAENFHRAVTAGRFRLHLERGESLQVLELDLGPGVDGLKIKDLRRPGEGRLMAVMREGKPLFFSRDTRLKQGDCVLAALDASDDHYMEQLLPGWERTRMRGRMERAGYQERYHGRKKDLKIVVAGCGRVGAQLAEMLSSDGYRVVVIDRDPSAFERLSKSFHGEVIEGLAFDMDVLREAGTGDAHAFAA